LFKLNEKNFKEIFEVFEFYFEIYNHIAEDEFTKMFKEKCDILYGKLISVGIEVKEKEYKEKDSDEIKNKIKDEITKEILKFFENEKKIKEGKISNKVKKSFNSVKKKLFSTSKYEKLE